ncbi:MAG: PAS domain S-box protein, partial [Thermodesulfobacteriota bacterium]|nr:PAS domain S-box protein [Thermodesulfobacteriota bacterium]
MGKKQTGQTIKQRERTQGGNECLLKERKQTEEILLRRDAILNAISLAAKRFLWTTDWKQNIQEVLEQLGKATGVSRVYIFENHTDQEGRLFTSQRYEWVAPTITPQIDNPELQNFPLRAMGFIRWEEILSQGHHIQGQVREFPESEQEVLSAQGIQSIVVVPIFTGQEWWGFIGFDECLTERQWSETEVDALETAAGILGAAIQHKKAEETLRGSEERYRTILENIEDGYFEVDLAGNFTFFNDAVCRMLGYSRDEIMGMNNQQYTDPENAKKLYNAFNKVYRTGIPTKGFEWEIIRKDGTKLYGEVSVSLIRNPNGQPIGFRGIVRDITERKKFEETLALSEERYRTLVEESFDGIWIQKGFKIAFANRRLYEMLGYEEGELESLDHWLVYHPDYQALTRERAQARMRGESIPSTYEVKFLGKDGSSFWGEIHAKVINFLGEPGIQVWARDISERKQAEEVLRASEERYRNILDNIEDGYYEVDIAGNFTFFNNSLCKILGYPEEEMMGMNNRVYMDKETARRVYQAYNQVYNTGEPLKAFGYKIIRKDGIERFLESHVSLLKNAKGERIGFRGIARDMTERKLSEEALYTERQRFQALSENAPFGMVMIDQDGTFRYMNPKFRKLFGYDLSDVPDGSTWFRKAYPDPTYRHHVVSAWIDDLKSSNIGEKRSRTFTVTCKDGTEKTIDFIPVQLEMGENLMACEDITEHKRAEEALRQAEKKYRSIFENVVEGIFQTAPAGHYISVNPALAVMHGFESPEEMIAEITNIQHQVYVEPDRRIEFRRLLEKYGEVRGFEAQFYQKDGSKIWVSMNAHTIRDASGTLLYYEGTVENITERKQAEEALRLSEERYRILVEESFDGIFVQKGPKIIFANQLLHKMLGYDKGEIEGLDHWLVYHPDYQELTRRRAQARMQGENVPSQYEVKLQRKDGSSFDGEINARKIMVGNEPGIQVWVRDITEQKQSEKEMVNLQEQLR